MTQKNGLLIDNYWCTGCHSCEVSCKNEKDLPIGQFGIKMLILGPYEKMEKGWGKDSWEHVYFPVLTSYCDLCEERVAGGDIPACQLHCLASVIEYGPLEELAVRLGELDRRATILIP